MTCLTNIIISHPESKDSFATLLISALQTEFESVAIITLHIINTIVINYRKSSKDSTDAVFVGKILDLGIGVMERNLSRV